MAKESLQHIRKEIGDAFKEGRIIAGLSAIMHGIFVLLKNAVMPK